MTQYDQILKIFLLFGQIVLSLAIIWGFVLYFENCEPTLAANCAYGLYFHYLNCQIVIE